MEQSGGATERMAFLVRLQEEHRALERRLTELESRVGLTADEQVERIQIKKLKLAKKDLILRQRRLLEEQAQAQAPPAR
jgi:hypothetical protein